LRKGDMKIKRKPEGADQQKGGVPSIKMISGKLCKLKDQGRGGAGKVKRVPGLGRECKNSK